MMGNWEFHLLFRPSVCLNFFLPQTGCLKILNKENRESYTWTGLQPCGDVIVEGQRVGGSVCQGVGWCCGGAGSQVGVERQRGEGDGAQGTFCSESR